MPALAGEPKRANSLLMEDLAEMMEQQNLFDMPVGSDSAEELSVRENRGNSFMVEGYGNLPISRKGSVREDP